MAGKLKGFDVAVEINEQRCRSCGICYEICPENVLGASTPLRKAVIENIDACTGCRLCEWLCTDWAINVVATPLATAAAGS
ncbi:MAG TPA: 4Fe-4S binding protein [Dehalococcoidia bacterium]|jgi:NAD-dependent dihydropyrimidine dehydrogenase PreA subunit|nr:4Fe-4S binding protein [Dehalococcoidia bacterium]